MASEGGCLFCNLALSLGGEGRGGDVKGREVAGGEITGVLGASEADSIQTFEAPPACSPMGISISLGLGVLLLTIAVGIVAGSRPNGACAGVDFLLSFLIRKL